MPSNGRDLSRSRDPKRTEIKRKIDDLTKIADELQKASPKVASSSKSSRAVPGISERSLTR
jgi:hypothetical protein